MALAGGKGGTAIELRILWPKHTTSPSPRPTGRDFPESKFRALNPRGNLLPLPIRWGEGWGEGFMGGPG